MRYRITELREYANCPKKYQIRKIWNFKPDFVKPELLFGTICHRLIKELHTNKEFDLDNLGTLFEFLWNSEETKRDIPIAYKNKWKETIEIYKKQVVEIFTNYLTKDYNKNSEFIFSEKRFEVDIDQFQFEGTIDEVRKFENKLILVDYKTGKTKPKIEVLKKDLQLRFYAYALKYGNLGINRIPDEMWIYFLPNHIPYRRNTKDAKKGDERGDPRYIVECSEWDIHYLPEDIIPICQSIEKGTFFRNPGAFTCGMCQYITMCQEDMQPPIISKAIIEKGKELILEE